MAGTRMTESDALEPIASLAQALSRALDYTLLSLTLAVTLAWVLQFGGRASVMLFCHRGAWKTRKPPGRFGSVACAFRRTIADLHYNSSK